MYLVHYISEHAPLNQWEFIYLKSREYHTHQFIMSSDGLTENSLLKQRFKKTEKLCQIKILSKTHLNIKMYANRTLSLSLCFSTKLYIFTNHSVVIIFLLLSKHCTLVNCRFSRIQFYSGTVV